MIFNKFPYPELHRNLLIMNGTHPLWKVSALGIFVVLTSAFAAEEALPEKVDFNKHIRPIFSNKCFACHGPDEKQREVNLRLDTKEGAFADRDGKKIIVPGKPDESELIRRVTTDDPKERMPLKKTNKVVTAREAQLLHRWIEQGAVWKEHWAYVQPKRPQVPIVDGAKITSPVDLFIQARLKEKDLKPSPASDRITLVRRLSFDLTGLPPKSAEVDAYVNDKSPDAYEKLVDRLLSSPHYGERMAVYWLDLVRYADSIGYHSDNTRNVAPYRDYVIQAFNDNIPFDQFTTEQISGDLLEEATLIQRVASGYNRLNQTTQEGGAQAGEYLTKYQADRVRNVSSVWMGATMGCAECHDHKFDPFTSKDFYSFAAFFADIEETPVGRQVNEIKAPTKAQADDLERMDKELAELQTILDTHTPEIQKAQEEWESDTRAEKRPTPPLFGGWYSVGPFKTNDFEITYKTEFGPEKGFDIKKTYGDGKLKWAKRPKFADGKVHALPSDPNAATYLYRKVTVAETTVTDEKDAADLALGDEKEEEDAEIMLEVPVELSLGSDDTIDVWLNGEKVLSKKVFRAPKADQDKITVNLVPGENHLLMKICNKGGPAGFYFSETQKGDVPNSILAIVAMPFDLRTKEQKAEIARHYRGITELLKPAREKHAALKTKRGTIDKEILSTLVSKAKMEPREIRILPRGNWMDSSGPVVKPAVPQFLKPLEVGERRANRLDLAKWLLDEDNPLTARVFVNRLWKLFFGQGLSKVLDDIGSQGAAPTHPELLDWLALEFRENDWDVKHMVKLLLMSDTYRQTSKATAELRAEDPYNQWYARQTFFRLDAEMVRDNALAVSGLLIRTLGGRSVKPYQPGGYWQHLNFPRRSWVQDKGESVWRRGLYTHWQRTFLHPSLLAFDAPSREECTAERPISDTPQQALVLLNDPTYVEAARVFAERIINEGGKKPADRIKFVFQEVLSREAKPKELQVMTALYKNHLKEYREDKEGAKKLLSTGSYRAPEGENLSELAAWTSIARATFNLYETITRY